jgi:competence protein ComEC
VTVIAYAGSKVILPGDNEPPSWKELLESANFRNAISVADILLAPHHGRESAFCSELFDCFNPRLTVISDGPCDTSAVSQYGAVTRGWEIHHRGGGSEIRKCVTTRKDGAIVVKFGYNDGRNPFIAVYID